MCKKLLVACEESQVVCKAFRAKGWEAYSCDIIECSGGHPEWHIMQDVLPLLNGNCEFSTMDGGRHRIDGEWDMIIAHPPCTYMSKAGARWMYPKAGKLDRQRLEKALAARAVWQSMMDARCARIAVENPRPLKVVQLPPPSQVIQPYEYGHPYSKATLLWLKGLPKLIPTKIMDKHSPYLPSNTGEFSRGGGGGRGVAHDARNASRTFLGVGEAMAEQWGVE